MKTFCTNLLMAACILTGVNPIFAQATGPKLNQVELLKQFAGSWQGELGKDTCIVGDNVVFGTGLVCNSQVIAKGKIVTSVKQLYGYDQKKDKFIVAELIESSPCIEICTTWFTSQTTGELIITNPENVTVNYKFEFRTPDVIVQTAIQDNKVLKEITLHRIKSE
jgi:hypothetical protein